MNYWLLKSEPESWSWDQQKAKGAKGEPWSGVRNFTAAKNMREMKKGDRGFFYHSGKERSIVGIVEVVKTAYPDPTDKDGKAVTVDIKPVQPVKQPVTLAAIKADPKFKEFKLVRQSRLSVVPVSDEHWKLILKMSDTK